MQLAHSIRSLGSSVIARRLAAATFWSAIGESLSKGLLLLSMILVARILGETDYGQFGLIRTTISMFATVGGVGLGFTANRYVARFRSNDPGYAGQIIGSSYLLAASFGGLIAVGVYFASGYLARTSLGAPQLQGALRIAAILLMLGAINGAQVGILQGLEAYRRLAAAALIQGLVALAAFTVGSLYYDLTGALGGLLLYTLAGVVVFHVLIRAELRRQAIPVSYRGLERVLPIFWSFSVPAALMGIAVAPFKWWAETLLAKGSGFGHLGVFHGSMTIMNAFLAIVSTLNSPLVSLTSNLPDARNSPRIHYVNLYGSWYLFLVLACPVLLFPELPSFLLGQQYASSQFHEVSLLLLLYCGLLTYYQGVMRLVAQYGSMWFGLFTNLCEGVTLIGVFYLLSGKGVVGLGLAYICSYVVRVVVTTPLLVAKGIISLRLILDKYFLATLATLCVLVAWQISRMS